MRILSGLTPQRRTRFHAPPTDRPNVRQSPSEHSSSQEEQTANEATSANAAFRAASTVRPLQMPMAQDSAGSLEVFAGLASKKIKSAGLRPTLRGLCGSGRAASGRSLRRSPARSGPSGTPAGLQALGTRGEGSALPGFA